MSPTWRGAGERVVGEMGRHEDRQVSFRHQVSDQRQQPGLVAEVQVGRGLVHDEHLGFLGQRPGDEHELPLAAAQLGVGAVGQVDDAHAFERVPGHLVVVVGRRGGQGHVGGAAREDHIEHVEGERGRVRLGHVGHQLRALAPGMPAQALALHPHLAGLGRDGAEDGAEQRGLAHPVGAEQAEVLPLAAR